MTVWLLQGGLKKATLHFYDAQSTRTMHIGPTISAASAMPSDDVENASASVGRFRFDVFEVNVSRGELWKQGVKIKLQEKPFQLLVLLLERAGRTTTREELRQGLWPFDTFVNFDNSLKTAVNKLRQALGDSADEPKFIKTIQLQGYRFVARVEALEAEESVAQQGRAHPSTDDAHAAPASIEKTLTRRNVWAGRLLAGALMVALAASVIYRITRKDAPAPVITGQRVVLLVLPFENLSGDPNQEYFSDGLTDEMITLLSRQYPKKLSVIARTSAMRYRGTRKPLELISHELGTVNYVLEGTVRRSGTQVAINAQLFRAQDQASLWAATYESDLGDLLTTQHNVSERIARSLIPEVVPGNVGRIYPSPAPKVYDAYLMGMYEANQRNQTSLRKSIGYFQDAIQGDPSYAPAYVGLANSYLVSAGWLLLRPEDAYPKAKSAALKALELDDNFAEAHATLAVEENEYEWKWAEAEHEYQRAIDLDPNSVMVHKNYAEFLMHSGRTKQAIVEIERARELDPLSLIANTLVGFMYFYDRQYDRSLDEYQKVVQLDPKFGPAQFCIGAVLLQLGRYDEGLAHLQLAKTLSNNGTLASAGVIRAYVLSGRRNLAERDLRILKSRASQEYISPYSLARISATFGDKKTALKMLHAAVAQHAVDIIFMKVDPVFDSLHDDPDFKNIIKKVGFPE
jgi:TolB-like protein/DNA-binding winged helix-turn-helix (wHTH) protein/Tfp pilus assembly protein PilF